MRGLKELEVALAAGNKEALKQVKLRLKESGEIVRRDAESRFAGISEKSASGFRVSVRQTGVYVQQSLRKTTGQRPDFGALQMTRALIPALEAREDEVYADFERALDDIVEVVYRF